MSLLGVVSFGSVVVVIVVGGVVVVVVVVRVTDLEYRYKVLWIGCFINKSGKAFSGLNDINRLNSWKKLLILMVGSTLASKWSKSVPFCEMDHQKPNFLLISDALSVGGCWGHPMLLFWKVVDETQMGNPRDHAARDISLKFSIFVPLRAI